MQFDEFFFYQIGQLDEEYFACHTVVLQAVKDIWIYLRSQL